MSSSPSSDSENDKPRVKQTPPPAPYGPATQPKKKKKILPPQESINKIWLRFSAPSFSKATVILPPSHLKTEKPKAILLQPEQKNVLVSEDFNRAVEECRNRVKKLIRECKRVNMRYRDSEFDIDWDLKWERGFCLNSLGGSKFEVSGRAFSNPASNVPKACKRVHEIFEKPTFKDKVTPADVRQGSLGDCWLMASLTALASMENGIQRICVEYDTKVGIYGFVFHRDGEWIISIIDDKLYLKNPDWDSPSLQRHLLELSDREDVEAEYRKTYQTGSQALYFAHCADQNETWLPLLEKAYAKAHGDYGALQGGWNGQGVEDLTGGVTTELLTSDILDTDEFWTNEILKVNKEFLFGCSTGLLDGGYGNRDGISEGHAYVVMEARELSTGERLLKLRNPWGKGKKGNWEGAWADGSKEFTPEAQIELNHKFGNDSVFWISYSDLLRKYQHFDRTRLFMDSPDWRFSQKWISIEVPWKAEFHQKFRIVLTKESPIVMVLSQLDDRYFEGLQGQYDFRLQFRVHEVGVEGEEDYIVRSHGNYLMNRSVVAELASLAAGTYAVFIQVVAERHPGQLTVEEVVKRQCKRKIDNEKLAQVGASYDFAHSKATVHLESRAAQKKAAERKKAKDTRMATRRKNWEKRHLHRDVFRKQDKKNREKRELKIIQDEKEARVNFEAKPKDAGSQTETIPAKAAVIIEDKGVQTESPEQLAKSENKSYDTETQQLNDTEKACQTDPVIIRSTSASSQATPDTPPSLILCTSPRSQSGLRSGSIHTGPPPPPPAFRSDNRKNSMVSQARNYNRGPPPQPNYITDEGESSASPISEFGDLFSDDDGVGAQGGRHRAGTKERSSGGDEEEDEAEAWNAVAVVGFRVFGMDKGMEVLIWEEGDEDEIEGSGDEGGTDGDADREGEKDEDSGKNIPSRIAQVVGTVESLEKLDEKQVKDTNTNTVTVEAVKKTSDTNKSDDKKPTEEQPDSGRSGKKDEASNPTKLEDTKSSGQKNTEKAASSVANETNIKPKTGTKGSSIQESQPTTKSDKEVEVAPN
ncbi:hypothetical protein HYFRA_00013975 [Hymenoscyphus fraxineus]|uniref:Calpain catalytic domain-containing protein n=1 Tax=Hymenoscyphus fraxineus TaxID=746836 RepID=A0A9N9L982_9HELO|nr:hypothetical protein HYFRA_00013975 [Hymenoscyphus fraxineus]